MKAVLLNRVGDVGFIIAVSLLFEITHSVDLTVLPLIISIIPCDQNILIFSFGAFNVAYHAVDLISFFLLIGVIGKSAQLGLHT